MTTGCLRSWETPPQIAVSSHGSDESSPVWLWQARLLLLTCSCFFRLGIVALQINSVTSRDELRPHSPGFLQLSAK